MKNFLLALVLLASPAAFADFQPVARAPHLIHLTFIGGTVHLHLTWQDGPALEIENVLHGEWHSGADHIPIEVPGTFKVELNMPAMGHGSSPTQIERVLDERGQPLLGTYNIRGLYFMMAGDWEVIVTLNTPDGKSESQKFTVHL
jgi:hypothetical protein